MGDKVLNCGCRRKPTYGSIYIARDLCPGHGCENDDQVLDWDEGNEQCICRGHPCLDDDGQTHSCNDPKYPILRYRLQNNPEDGSTVSACECVAKFDHTAKVDQAEL